MINLLSPIDEKIVLFGQSCVGKTTFSTLLKDHKYYCFDALFPWHLIETFNLSISSTLRNIKCYNDSYVLDGWHTSDLEGDLIPTKSKIYVIYSEYETILKQFPREVNYKELFHMFEKWYSFEKLNARYFYNKGDFQETTFVEYKTFIKNQISYVLKQNL